LRWGLALLVAGAALWFFLDATADKVICKDTLTGTKSAPEIVQLCGPPRLLDLTPFVLLIAILLWPDLSEIGITGLVTLKRRLEEQEEKQVVLEDRLSSLHQTFVQTATAIQGQSQASTTNIQVGYAPDQDDVRRGIEEKGKRSGESGPREEQIVDLAGHAQLMGVFLREYADLEPYILATSFRRPPPRWINERLTHLDEGQRRVVEQWHELYSGEIAALRQTRNVVVHDPHTVSEATLRKAVDNTHELARILHDRLGVPSLQRDPPQ
jgi:hypothetical protein